MARTKINTQDNTKTRIKPGRNRHSGKLFVVLFGFFFYFHWGLSQFSAMIPNLTLILIFIFDLCMNN